MLNFVLFTSADLNWRVAEVCGRIIFPSFYSGGHSFDYTYILHRMKIFIIFFKFVGL